MFCAPSGAGGEDERAVEGDRDGVFERGWQLCLLGRRHPSGQAIVDVVGEYSLTRGPTTWPWGHSSRGAARCDRGVAAGVRVAAGPAAGQVRLAMPGGWGWRAVPVLVLAAAIALGSSRWPASAGSADRRRRPGMGQNRPPATSRPQRSGTRPATYSASITTPRPSRGRDVVPAIAGTGSNVPAAAQPLVPDWGG